MHTICLVKYNTEVKYNMAFLKNSSMKYFYLCKYRGISDIYSIVKVYKGENELIAIYFSEEIETNGYENSISLTRVMVGVHFDFNTFLLISLPYGFS